MADRLKGLAFVIRIKCKHCGFSSMTHGGRHYKGAIDVCDDFKAENVWKVLNS